MFTLANHWSVLTCFECDRQSSEPNTPTPGTFLDEDLSLVEDTVPHTPIPGPSLVLDSGQRALERLINRSALGCELVSLIEAIFSSRRATEIVDGLTGSDAQTFIDVMDEVRHQAPPSAKNELTEYLILLHYRRWRVSISHRGPEGNV